MGTSHSHRGQGNSSYQGYNKSSRSKTLCSRPASSPKLDVPFSKNKTGSYSSGIVFLPNDSNIKEQDNFGAFRFGRSEKEMTKSRNPYMNEHESFNEYYFASEKRIQKRNHC